MPGRQDKEELKAAGLGEDRIHIGLRASAEQLHQKCLVVYPKLENAGGYELLRCLPNSRSLTRLQPSSCGHTPESLKKDVGQARIYIRPLQRDLDTTASQDGDRAASESVQQPSVQNSQVHNNNELIFSVCACGCVCVCARSVCVCAVCACACASSMCVCVCAQ